MAKVKYILQYLPTFYSDIEEHVMYISDVLKNVQAANELLNNVGRYCSMYLTLAI